MKNDSTPRAAQITAQVASLMDAKVNEVVLTWLFTDAKIETVYQAMNERDAVKSIIGAAR